MRKTVLFAAAFFPACSTMSAAPPADLPVRGDVEGRICQQGPGDRFVGQTATTEVGAAILAATNAATLRWIRPGMLITLEFGASRVNVRYGPDMKIQSVNCG